MRSVAESQLGRKLVMLLFVLAICAPSYGNTAVLVYRVTIIDKPVIVDLYQPGNAWTAPSIKSSASFKGFLVFDVNTTTLFINTPVDDANFTPTLILNGADPQTKAKKQQWVEQGTVTINPITIGTKKYAQLGWEATGSGSTDPNYSNGQVLGKCVRTVLVTGGTTKVDVPKSLKGQGGFYKTSSSIGNLYLVKDGPSSTTTLTLDVAKTKKANTGNLTVQQMADSLK